MDEEIVGEVIGPNAILLQDDRKKTAAPAEAPDAEMHPLWRLLISREARWVLVVAGLASAIIPWYVQPSGTQFYTLLSAMTQSGNAGLELGGVLFFMGLAMLAFSSVWWNAAGDVTIFVGLLMGNGAIAADVIPRGSTWVNGDGASIAWAVLLISFVLLLARLRMED
ncbi:MAG: hypothetical protein WCK39_05245 [Methanomassiliicoccales archaeon]